MPPLEELQNPINKYASQVLSEEGKLLGTWSRSENRVFVNYDENYAIPVSGISSN